MRYALIALVLAACGTPAPSTDAGPGDGAEPFQCGSCLVEMWRCATPSDEPHCYDPASERVEQCAACSPVCIPATGEQYAAACFGGLGDFCEGDLGAVCR
jgi:hypothetical protein